MVENTPDVATNPKELKALALLQKKRLQGGSFSDTEARAFELLSKKLGDIPLDFSQGASLGQRFEFGKLGSRPELVERLLKKQFGEENVKNLDGVLLFRETEDEPFKPVNPKQFDLGDVAEFGPSAARFATTLGAGVAGGLGGFASGGPVGAGVGGVLSDAIAEGFNEFSILNEAQQQGLLTPEEVNEITGKVATSAVVGGGLGAGFGAGGLLGGKVLAKLGGSKLGQEVIKTLNKVGDSSVAGSIRKSLERFGVRGKDLTKIKGQVGEAAITQALVREQELVEPSAFGEIIQKNVSNFISRVNKESSNLLDGVRQKVLADAETGNVNFADASDFFNGLQKEIDVLQSQGAFDFSSITREQLEASLQQSLNNVNNTLLGGSGFDATKVTAADLLNTRVGLQDQIKRFSTPGNNFNPQISKFLISVKKGIDESIDSSLSVLGNSIDDEIIDDSFQAVSKIGNIKIPKKDEFLDIRKGLKQRADGFKVIDSKTRELTYKNKSGDLLTPERVTRNVDSIDFNKARAGQVNKVISQENPEDLKELIPALRQKQLVKAERGEKGTIREAISPEQLAQSSLLEESELKAAQEAGIDITSGFSDLKKLSESAEGATRRGPSFRAGSVVDQTKRSKGKLSALLGDSNFKETVQPLEELADFQAAQDKQLTTRGLFDVVERAVTRVPVIGGALAGFVDVGEGISRQAARNFGAPGIKFTQELNPAASQNLLKGFFQTESPEQSEEERRLFKLRAVKTQR